MKSGVYLIDFEHGILVEIFEIQTFNIVCLKYGENDDQVTINTTDDLNDYSAQKWIYLGEI